MTDEPVEELADIDWRFAEFTSAPAHVLYSTCAELLTLPKAGENVGNALIDIIIRGLGRGPTPYFLHMSANNVICTQNYEL